VDIWEEVVIIKICKCHCKWLVFHHPYKDLYILNIKLDHNTNNSHLNNKDQCFLYLNMIVIFLKVLQRYKIKRLLLVITFIR
jgi:hypothetical protein